MEVTECEESPVLERSYNPLEGRFKQLQGNMFLKEWQHETNIRLLHFVFRNILVKLTDKKKSSLLNGSLQRLSDFLILFSFYVT